MGDDDSAAVAAIQGLAAARAELQVALEELAATCRRTAQIMRAAERDRVAEQVAAHPDLADLEALLDRFYG